MSYRIRIITEDAAWDELLSAVEHPTVYHRSGWLGVLNECTDAHMVRIALESPNGLLAIWPFGLLRKGPIRIAGSPLPGWNTAYLGPLFTKACTDKTDAVRMMYTASPIRKPAFLATRLMDTTVDLNPAGFKLTKNFETYEIDLTLPAEDLWSRLKGVCRTQIRKGEKNGVEIREEHDASYLDDFMAMATDVFAKSYKHPPYSKRFLQAVERRLRTRGELLVVSAFHAATRIATLIIPHDQKSAMYFAGSSYASTLRLSPNNILHWNLILMLKSRMISRYDLVSSKGPPGKFKSTFSPNPRLSALHWEVYGMPGMRAAKTYYEKRLRQASKLR